MKTAFGLLPSLTVSAFLVLSAPLDAAAQEIIRRGWDTTLLPPTALDSGGSSNSLSFAPRLDLPALDGLGQVVIADLDGDGKLDVVVNSGQHFISIYQNIISNGALTAGSFASRVDFLLGSGGENSMVAADLNGDGKPEIVLLDYYQNQVMVLQNLLPAPGIITTNSFSAPVRFPVGGSGPRGLAVQDLDGDGKPDVATGNWGDSTVTVLRNLGQAGDLSTNSFAAAVVFATGANPQTLAIGDLDGDGKPDVVTANNNYGTSESASLLRNTSTPGTVSLAPHVDLAGLPTSFCVVIGDLDGDGKPDLAVSSFVNGQAVSVYRNVSTPGSLTTNSFAPNVDFSTGGWGNAVAIGDLDGDGKPDLAVVTQLPDHFSVFINTSTPGSFTTNSLAPRVDCPAGWNPNGVAIGDLDGDGRPDIAFAVTYAATLSVYQNQTMFAPVIALQPSSQTVVQGSGAVLSVTASGALPFSYQWTFNGTNIAGATNASLTLANLHVYQSGNYGVIVTNLYGTVTSSNATLTVTAQNILVYSYTGVQKTVTAGQALVSAVSGQIFFIPDSTNGAFVGWTTCKGRKQYWVNPLPVYLWITIPSLTGRAITLLGQAGQWIDTNGYPNLLSDLHKGRNALLTIGKGKTFSFPNTLDSEATHAYPDPQTGKMVLTETSSMLLYMPRVTQNANDNGQTLTDLIHDLTQWLANQGYQPP
jgi:hypothetical protein